MYKASFILLASILILNHLNAENIIKSHENGNPKLKYNTDKDGLKTGLYQEFYENGKPKLKANYKKGKLNGKYTTYDENGKLIIHCSYKKEKLHGKYKSYKNGKLKNTQVYISGILAYPKPLKNIKATLKRISGTKVPVKGDWPADQMDKARFDKKSISDNQEGIKRLMSYRYLSDIPYKDMNLNQNYIAHSLAATDVLTLVGKLTHFPKNPGMPEKEFKFAYQGTSHTNIAMSSSGMNAKRSVDMYMFDSDKSNITRVGHRRWCLNPAMQATGFGSKGSYSAMWSPDKKRTNIPDFDYVAYPSRGYYPRTYFSSKHAWSISLNPKKYKRGSSSNIQVNVYPVNAAFKVSKQAMEIENYKVNTAGVGLRYCIIFKPKGFSTAPKKRYYVEITGINKVDGSKAEIKYYVEFF